MSPIPPPPGSAVHTEDWTDDPSFDIDISPSQFILPALPSTPSSSSSSTSHRSLSSLSRRHAESPLRSSHTPTRHIVEDDEDGLDLPDSFPAIQSRSRSTTDSSSRSIRNLSSTIMGAGPNGGTITRLGSAGSPKALGGGAVKAHLVAVTKAWEADIDFDEDFDDFDTVPTIKGLPSNLQTIPKPAQVKQISPPKLALFRKPMPGPDALDDLDGFGDEIENDDEATLKAGATIKAMLPPPKKKGIESKPKTPKVTKPLVIDEEIEEDLVLPLNMSNLKLVTQSYTRQESSSSSKIRPRVSVASNNTDWGSPGNSSAASGKESLTSWGDTSNKHKRYSETSATSISDSFKSPKHPPKKQGQDEEIDEEEDMESGLVMPNNDFFAPTRAKELNRILDTKRKPQYAPAPNQQDPTANSGHKRTGTDETWRTGDESVEDGLIFDDPRVDFSKRKLDKSRKARTPVGLGTKKGAGVAGTNPLLARRDKERREKERDREKGWIRGIPVTSSGPSVRERTQSSLTIGLSSGNRSNSASATNTLNNMTTKRVDALSSPHRPRSSLSAITSSPPPYSGHPSSSQTPSSTQTRLRHQKSHAVLSSYSNIHSIPPPSPALTRQKSLASLQETARHAAVETPPPHRNYNSTSSRLTAPTTSSAAKARTRPPVMSIFPGQQPQGFATSSSASSMSTSGSREIVTPHQYPYAHGQGHIGHPRAGSSGSSKGGSWGKKDHPHGHPHGSLGRRYRDGTELEGIADLSVEDEREPKGTVSTIGIGRPKKGYENPTKSTIARSRSGEERKEAVSAGAKEGHKRKRNRDPALIRYMGGNVDQKKVVGGMTWNPAELRWEGNESVLKDFEPPSAPTVRPALIAHLTGSSLTGMSSPVGNNQGIGTVRIVGDMKFDPERMCWISTLDPEDEEPDPFDGMADDEDESIAGGRGGTIKGKQVKNLITVNPARVGSTSSSTWSSRLASESGFSAVSVDSNWTDTPARTRKDSDHEQRQGQENGQGEISRELWEECREAEERHKSEMRGWMVRSTATSTSGWDRLSQQERMAFEERIVREQAEKRDRERRRKWDIWHLAHEVE